VDHAGRHDELPLGDGLRPSVVIKLEESTLRIRSCVLVEAKELVNLAEKPAVVRRARKPTGVEASRTAMLKQV
jgi:hypothetical protein